MYTELELCPLFCVRETHMLRVLENRVLRKIFGHKRDGVNRRVEKTAKRGAL
jgi:hypothetical protein